MFSDDTKTPSGAHPLPTPKDEPPVKLKDDDTKEPYRFTDWAQI